MAQLLTIELNNLAFHAYHGVYEEERKTGTAFEVNVSVSFQPGPGIITGLDETVNYVSLYEVVKKQMQIPRPLIETVAMDIAEDAHNVFPSIQAIEISITKAHPPISGFAGAVGVRLKKDYP